MQKKRRLTYAGDRGDPKSHPTKQRILDHTDAYQDGDNAVIKVSGRAFYRTDDNCEISGNKTKVTTGSCVDSRCRCSGASWTGPRCTTTLSIVVGTGIARDSYGPPFYIALGTSGLTILATFGAIFATVRTDQKQETVRKQKWDMAQPPVTTTAAAETVVGANGRGLRSNENYSTNFV